MRDEPSGSVPLPGKRGHSLTRTLTHHRHARRTDSRRQGFTLGITLMLMILLNVIAVGLLTLSSVSLRTATRGDALASAGANFRLSLLFPIGQLQSLSGSDTHVNARADIFDAKNPPQFDPWKSWHGGDLTPPVVRFRLAIIDQRKPLDSQVVQNHETVAHSDIIQNPPREELDGIHPEPDRFNGEWDHKIIPCK